MDVVEAIKASNFNKGLGPDGFDGSKLKPGDSSHQPTQALSAQILGLLKKLMSIPKYLYEGRLVPLSKNKGKDQAELKDIRPIVVRSHLAKILEKAIMAKVLLWPRTYSKLGFTRQALRRAPLQKLTFPGS